MKDEGRRREGWHDVFCCIPKTRRLHDIMLHLGELFHGITSMKI